MSVPDSISLSLLTVTSCGIAFFPISTCLVQVNTVQVQFGCYIVIGKMNLFLKEARYF